MRHCFVIGAMMALTATATTAQAPKEWELNGTKIGDSLATKELAKCSRSEYLPDRVRTCIRSNQAIAELRATILTTYLDNRLVKWTAVFPPDKTRPARRNRWQDVKFTFEAAFGPPAKTESITVQNRLGAKFPSEQLTWLFPLGRMELAQMVDRIDEAWAAVVHDSLNTFIRSAEDSARAEATRKAIKKGGVEPGEKQ